jgi:imidazolonepropionase
MSDLLITNLSEVTTPVGSTPRVGEDLGRIERHAGAEVLVSDGKVAFIGSTEERERVYGTLAGTERLDGNRGTLIPGFVDPHTHLPWAGTREEEFVRRLAGASYMEIAADGGGILATVRSTREATEEQLVTALTRRLDQMLAWGTTTAEAKSGYGLSTADELKQLRAVRAADVAHQLELAPTLLAAHEVPPEYRDDRERYIDLVCEEITPAVAEARLARFCDVFCEKGVFSADESRRILLAGKQAGLAPRLHADEFVDSGGAELAAEMGALSADHLMAISDDGIAAMARSGVIGILLPGTSFFLMKRDYAPARRLIEAGVPVALATDCNPGSSHTESMPMILVLAVLQLGLTIDEALTAATLNAACSLGLGDRVGSIEVGKQADLVLLDAPNHLHLAYHYGINPVAAVVKSGQVVHRAQ